MSKIVQAGKQAATHVKQRLKDRREQARLKARRLGYRIKHDYLKPETILIAIAIVACLSWTWGGISSMSRNWELAQRLDARQKELQLLKLEVETMELENEYLRSEEYQELAARHQQNKLLPGEKMVYLPDNTPAARDKYKEVEAIEPAPPSNIEQWFSFLFGV